MGRVRGENSFGKFSLLNGVFLFIFVLIFSLNFVFSAPILDQLHLNIQTTDTSGNVVTGTFNFAFNISNESDCSPVIYSNLTTLTTDSRGIISYYLENTNLNYDSQYYLCYYRNGVLIETSEISRTPYSFRAQNVTTSGIIVDSNLNLGGYNLTASYLFGDGRYLTNINVSAINLSNYYNISQIESNFSNYFTKSQITGFGYYNLTNFNISDYLLKSQWNATNTSYYLASNPFNFLNETTLNLSFTNYWSKSGSNLYYNGGNIGIGTNDPLTLLHVQGKGSFGDSVTVDNAERALNLISTDAVLRILRVSANINTSAPAVELIHRTSADGADTDYWDFYVDGNGFNIRDRAPTNQVRLTLNGNGNTGVGISSPQAKLHVNGSGIYNGTLTTDGNRIINIGNGTSAQDAVTLSQLQSVNNSATASETDPKWTGNSTLVPYLASANTFTNRNIFSTTNNDSNTTSTAIDINGAYIRLGDQNSGLIMNNGIGIKFHDGGIAHGSLIYNSTTDTFMFCGSSANSVLTCTDSVNFYVDGTINTNGNRIINIGNGTSAQDAVTLSQLQSVNNSATASETDPFWTGNYTLFNSTWSSTYNATYHNFLMNGTFYLASNPFSFYNSTTLQNLSQLNNNLNFINGTYGNATYVLQSNLSNLSVNNSNNLGGYPSTFFMPLNTSVYGQFDFNGGWTSNGLSIINGNIYAQEGYFYKINSLQVTNLAINGSLIPAIGFDNQFDLGNSSLRWRDLSVGRHVTVGGNLTVDSGTFLVDSSLNKVSIGAGVPSYKLDVYEDNGAYEVIRARTNTTGANTRYVDSSGNIIEFGSQDGLAVIRTAGVGRLWINNTGSIGIGISSPQAKLHVNGSVIINGTLTTDGNRIINIGNGTSAQDVVTLSQLQAVNNSATASETDPKWTGNSTLVPYLASENNFTNNNIFNQNLTVDANTLFVNSNTNRVGIGTNLPTQKLDVDGTIRSNISDSVSGSFTTIAYQFSEGRGWGYNLADDAVFYNGASGNIPFVVRAAPNNSFYLNSNGNVGIGISSPQAKLHVNGSVIINGTLTTDGNRIINIGNGTSAQDAVTLSQLQSVNNSATASETDPFWSANYTLFNSTWSSTYNATYHNFLMNGTFYLASNPFSFYNSTTLQNLSQLNNNLNFINGTYGNATYILRNGDTITSGNYIFPANFTIDSNTFFVSSNTNRVGIGTTSPLSPLQVNGNIYSSGGAYGSKETGSNIIHIVKPAGATYNSGSASANGSIKITLPTNYTRNDMIRMTVDIYDYANDESFTVFLGGFTHVDSDNWYNTFTQIISGKVDRNFSVRFGHDGSNSSIWIGETTSNWAYLKVIISDVAITHDATSTFENWASGWSVTLDTDFTGDVIQVTESNNLVSPWISSGNNSYYAYPGNVGIGASSPGTRLQVSGSGAASPTLGSNGGSFLITNNDVNYGILSGVFSSGNGWLQVQRVDSTPTAYNLILQPLAGNVSVGTILSLARLHVNGSGLFNGTLTIHNGTSAQDAVTLSQLQVVNSTASASEIDPFWTGNSTLVPYLASANNFTNNNIFNQNLTVDSRTFFVNSNTNRVGIGTLNPTYNLEVNGTGFFNDHLNLNQSADIKFANNQYIDDNGAGGLRILSPIYSVDIYSGTDSNSGIKFFTNGTNQRLLINSTGDFNFNSDVYFKNQFGRVGIGTTDPIYRLHIVGEEGENSFLVEDADAIDLFSITGDAAANGDFISQIGFDDFYFKSDFSQPSFDFFGGDVHILDNSGTGGRLGIGTSLPTALLDVRTNSTNTIEWGNTAYPVGRITYSGDDAQIYAMSGGSLSLGSNSIPARFYIDENGNVGIGTGTTNPTQRLEINGSILSYGNLSLKANGFGVTISSGASAGPLAADSLYIVSGNNPGGNGSNLYLDGGSGVSNIDGNVLLASREMGANVGISTGAPIYKLHVNGSFYSDSVVTNDVLTGNINGSSANFDLNQSFDFVIKNDAVLSAGAQNGFVYIPTIEDAPSGTPSKVSGLSDTAVPMTYDVANQRLWIYDPVSGWGYVTLTF